MSRQNTDSTGYEIADFGTLTSYGVGQDPSGILHRPMDAVLGDDRVFILDVSPPWVKVFTRKGEFIAAIVRKGEGPGEVTRPMSLSQTRDGGLIVGHVNGIEVVRESGEVIQSIRMGLFTSGALEACDGKLVVLVNLPTATFGTALLLVSDQGVLLDTLFTVQHGRRGSRDMHAWLAVPTERGLLLYPEEASADRLVELDCDGNVRQDVTLDSLGPPMRVTVGGGRFLARNAHPPHPAGLLQVGGKTLWSTREMNADGDSITVLKSLDGMGNGQVVLKGWYQLLDGDERTLLFGNAWTLRMNWLVPATTGAEPVVYAVDTQAVFKKMEESSEWHESAVAH